MDAELRLQEADERAQKRAARHARKHHERNLDDGGEVALDADDGGDDGTENVLALSADVEEAGLEGERYADARQQNGRGLDDDVRNVLGLAQRALEERRERCCGVEARSSKHDGRHGKADEDCYECCRKAAAEELLELAHFASPPAMRRPSWFSSTVPWAKVPVIWPW